MDFHFLMEQSFFKKLYIRAFTIVIDDLIVFLFRDVPLKAYIYGSFDLYGFKTRVESNGWLKCC